MGRGREAPNSRPKAKLGPRCSMRVGTMELRVRNKVKAASLAYMGGSNEGDAMDGRPHPPDRKIFN